MKVRMLFLLLTVFASLVCRGADPAHSWVIKGFDSDVAREWIIEYGTTGLEGLWMASEDGATVAIISADTPHVAAPISASSGATLLLVIAESPRPAIIPGTVLGWAKMAAKPGKWDATIFTHSSGETLSAPSPFTLSLADDNHLTVTSARTGLKIAPRIYIPHLGRLGLTQRNEREHGLDGFIRMWPPSATTPPPFPVYL